MFSTKITYPQSARREGNMPPTLGSAPPYNTNNISQDKRSFDKN